MSAGQVPDSDGRGQVCMDLRPGERLVLGGTGIEVEYVHKSGKAARLRVAAPRSVHITRRGDELEPASAGRKLMP
jgi:hypothetical protein